jgi:hypothetical protein
MRDNVVDGDGVGVVQGRGRPRLLDKAGLAALVGG